MPTLCLVRRIALVLFGAVSLALATGVIPHPSVQLARTLMYLSLAIAIVAIGAAWRPRKA